MPSSNSLLVFSFLISAFAAVSAVESVPSELTQNERDTLLHSHNEYRRKVVPSGSNLRLFTWDDNLANQAQAYVDKCIYAHSKQYSFEPYGTIGENIYITTANLRDNPTMLRKATTNWYNEQSDYDFKTNVCRPNKMCGHYTQVVWDNTYMVGCGLKHCEKRIKVNGDFFMTPFMVVCKYGPGGNVRRLFSTKARKPYTSGKWCSECPDDAPFCNDRLCHTEKTNGTVTVLSTPTETKKNIDIARIGPGPELVSTAHVTVLPGKKTDSRLKCYLCKGVESVETCIVNNQTRICGENHAMDGMNDDWSCVSYTQNFTVMMDCLPTSFCPTFATSFNGKCCKEDFCNHGSGSDAISLSIHFDIVSVVFAAIVSSLFISDIDIS